jgi:hypothetical protein
MGAGTWPSTTGTGQAVNCPNKGQLPVGMRARKARFHTEERRKPEASLRGPPQQLGGLRVNLLERLALPLGTPRANLLRCRFVQE